DGCIPRARPDDFLGSPDRSSRSNARSGAGSLRSSGSRRFDDADGRWLVGGSAGLTPGGSAAFAGTMRPKPSRSVTADAPVTTALPSASDARSASADASLALRGPKPRVQAYHAAPAQTATIAAAVAANRHVRDRTVGF